MADDPRRPRIEKVIERDELVRATGLTRPHTVHCMPGENIVISMLGDADGNGACGFAVLDARTFEVKGRWENGGPHPRLNYDFWYQPRQNVLASSEFGEPNAYEAGLRPRRRRRRALRQPPALLEPGRAPRSSRRSSSARPGWCRSRCAGCTTPTPTRASSAPRCRARCGTSTATTAPTRADQVIAVDGVEQEGWPFPVPGLITDLVVSMDDRFLYFSNWLHGDLRQYDISDPANPRLTGQLQLGGVLGRPSDAGRELERRPADAPALARRPPAVRHQLALLDLGQPVLPRPALVAAARQLRRPTAAWSSTRDFFVDLHDRPDGPARAHEVRLQGGDCTTEIFQ